ncbi:hypothetical protein A9Q86_13925 [Flavobacteriales bacterium 33_180_T64]|nr:hypothetical protein A9Q86_13925 [Flavobacteriales bacterium 33_180_T64]
METYNQHIELINNYLNNVLSDDAKSDFKDKLQSDIAFNTLYEEHIVFLKGLDRIQIKSDIQKGKRSYHTEKWLKISGVSILFIGVFMMLYTLISNASENNPTSNNEVLNPIVLDSATTQKPTINKVLDISEDKVIKNESNIEEYDATIINKTYKSITATPGSPKKEAQIIRVNTQKDTSITCKEGTILKIKKGSFINPNTKKIATGTIDLKITEYYKLSDILMANLSTVSYGKLLETGGMIYIEVLQNETVLELKENSDIEISFSTKNKKSNMQLFYGQWTGRNINWELQNDVLEELNISEEIIEVPFAVIEQVPTFPGCEAEGNESRKKCTSDAISKFISRNFNTDIGLGLGLSGRQRINCIFKIDQDGNIIFIQSRATHPRLSEEANRVVALLPKMIPGMQRGKSVVVPYSLPLLFTIEGKSNATRQFGNSVVNDTISMANLIFNRPVEMDTVYKNSRGIIETIREVMHDKYFVVDTLFIQEWNQYKKQRLIREIDGSNFRRFILRKTLFEMKDSKFKILEDDSITRGGHVIRIPWNETKIPTTTQILNLVPKQRYSAGTETVTAEEFEDRLGSQANENISSRDVSYYVLKTSNLGWINCDRFINGRTKRIKYKLKIKNAEEASINMVFKSLNTILPSWYTNGVYDFQTVPKDEDIVLVAIKRKNGKLYFDTIETQTKVNPQMDFNFKEVTIDELKKELEIFNNLNN